MENQPRFDLNAAVENWRNELTAQPNLASDDRRELETHLRDAIAGFQQRGLNDEESFWLARRRVGQPQPIGEEFEKADPAKIWRERMFWMTFGFLIIRLWNTLASSVVTPLFLRANFHGGQRLEDLLPQWVSFYLPDWLRDLHYASFFIIFLGLTNALLVLAVLILLARGKLEKVYPALEFTFKTRLRFILLAIAAVILVFVVGNIFWNSLTVEPGYGNFTAVFFSNAFWFVCLIPIVAWLIPAQNQKTPKRA